VVTNDHIADLMQVGLTTDRGHTVFKEIPILTARWIDRRCADTLGWRIAGRFISARP